MLELRAKAIDTTRMRIDVLVSEKERVHGFNEEEKRNWLNSCLRMQMCHDFEWVTTHGLIVFYGGIFHIVWDEDGIS